MASARTTVSSAGPILGWHTGGLKKLGRWTLKGDNLQPTYPPRLDSGTPAERPAPGGADGRQVRQVATISELVDVARE